MRQSHKDKKGCDPNYSLQRLVVAAWCILYLCGFLYGSLKCAIVTKSHTNGPIDVDKKNKISLVILVCLF